MWRCSGGQTHGSKTRSMRSKVTIQFKIGSLVYLSDHKTASSKGRVKSRIMPFVWFTAQIKTRSNLDDNFKKWSSPLETRDGPDCQLQGRTRNPKSVKLRAYIDIVSVHLSNNSIDIWNIETRSPGDIV